VDALFTLASASSSSWRRLSHASTIARGAAAGARECEERDTHPRPATVALDASGGA
jgi:hypothetical protein